MVVRPPLASVPAPVRSATSDLAPVSSSTAASPSSPSLHVLGDRASSFATPGESSLVPPPPPPLPLSVPAHASSPALIPPSAPSPTDLVGNITTTVNASLASSPTSSIPNSQPILVGTQSSSPWLSAVTDHLDTCRIPQASVKVLNGTVHSSIPEELLKGHKPLWSKLIVGHFIGESSPHIGKVHATVNRLWSSLDKKSKVDAQFIGPKAVLFRIEDEATRLRVLRRHFWHISDILMVVQAWTPASSKKPPDMSSIPLWVDFEDVPDSLFSRKGLMFLANLVGKAQKLHPSTERCTRFDVARVLVEVNLTSDLPNMISLEGQPDISIPIAYPWLPPRCSKCGIWGHKLAECIQASPANAAAKSQVNAPCSAAGNTSKEGENRGLILNQIHGIENHPSDGLDLPTSRDVSISLDKPVELEATKPDIEATPTAIPPSGQEGIELSVENAPTTFPSSSKEIAPAIPPPSGIDNSELSWTVVSKSKGSPGRTIMTRGKCVAPNDSLQSRFQPLGIDAEDQIDVEEGEIEATVKHPSTSSDEDNSDDHLSQLASLEARTTVKKSTKKLAARRKDVNKVSRQTIKSKKSSSRKA